MGRAAVLTTTLVVVAITSAFSLTGGSPVVVSDAAHAFSEVSGNTSCLSPEQDKQLKEAITTIRGLFDTAIAALDVAYAAEKNPTTKQDLGIAITVLRAVNKEILANLTSIAEEACPTCSNITTVVQRSIATIEATLARIDPNWQKDPIWKAVFSLVNTLLDVVKKFCPSGAAVAAGWQGGPLGNTSCLTPEQDKQLKEAITTIRGLFDTAILALKVAYTAEPVPAIKHNLEIAITVLQAVNQDILANLTSIADEACPTCSNITTVVQRSVDTIEEALEKIDPDWQKDPIWKAVFTLVHSILAVVKDICPSTAVPTPVATDFPSVPHVLL